MDAPLPPDVPSHADTMKFADKIDPFDPTSNRVDTQLMFRRYVQAVALRSPATKDIRGYGRVTFDLAALTGDEKKELRSHLATFLLHSTRGAASDLLMGVDDQEDGRTMLLSLVEEHGVKYDGGAVAMAALDAMALNTYMGIGPFRADWQRNNRAYFDSTGSAIPLAMQRRQFLEVMRTHAHATTRDPPRGLEALAGLHSALMAKTLTPEQMFGELTTACNALTASGVDVFAGNKVGTDLVLPAVIPRGTGTCESCNGRGTVEAAAHHYKGQ